MQTPELLCISTSGTADIAGKQLGFEPTERNGRSHSGRSNIILVRYENTGGAINKTLSERFVFVFSELLVFTILSLLPTDLTFQMLDS